MFLVTSLLIDTNLIFAALTFALSFALILGLSVSTDISIYAVLRTLLLGSKNLARQYHQSDYVRGTQH